MREKVEALSPCLNDWCIGFANLVTDAYNKEGVAQEQKVDMRDRCSCTALLAAAIFLTLIGLGIIYSHCGLTPTRFPPAPSSLSPEGAKVKEAILEAYHQMGGAGPTFDTLRLDEFFIDDPRFPLRRELRKEVELAFGEVPEGAGYLTYMRAWYKNWEKRGTPALEKVWQEATHACRPKLKSLEAQIGYFPTIRRRMMESLPEGWEEKRFRFFEFEIQGDKAVCFYEDCGTLRRAYLVNKGGRWFIADSILLAAYPYV